MQKQETVSINQPEHKDWDAFVESSNNGTIYHLSVWKEIFESCFGYKAFYLKSLDSSGRIDAIEPVFLVRNILTRKMVSIPFRDRGGPLWNNEIALQSILESIIRLAIKNKTPLIQIKSVHPIPLNITALLNFKEELYWVRSLVTIDFTTESLWKKIGAKTRNMIRQAQKESLVFKDEQLMNQPVREFYRIFLDTQKKLGIPPFPCRFFSMMYDALKVQGRIKIFFVLKDEKPIASSIIFLFRNTAIYAYSSSLQTALSARTNDFMMWNILNWLLRNGFEYFDMGSDAPSQEGLLFFKKKWLAKQERIFTYYRSSLPDKFLQIDSSQSKYIYLRKCFSNLPLPIFKFFGNRITKYFG